MRNSLRLRAKMPAPSNTASGTLNSGSMTLIQFHATRGKLLLDVPRVPPDVVRVTCHVRNTQEVGVVAQDLRLVRLPVAPRRLDRRLGIDTPRDEKENKDKNEKSQRGHGDNEKVVGCKIRSNIQPAATNLKDGPRRNRKPSFIDGVRIGR